MVKKRRIRKKSVALTMLVAMICQGAPARPQEECEATVQKAVLEADWARVIEAARDWQRSGAKPAIVHWLLGYAGLATSDYQAAVRGFINVGSTETAEYLLEWAESLAGHNPSSATAHMLKGDALARSGKYDHAIAALDEAIHLQPGSALVYNLRGVVKALADRPVDAEADLEKAISVDPDLVDALVDLAIIRLEDEDLLGALSYLDQAVTACSDSALAYNARAIVYYRLKAWEESERDFEKAKELAPTLPFLTGNLKLMAWAKGQEQFKLARSADMQAAGRGTTLVASSYDRHSVDIGDGRIVDIISIKNTPQTATLAGMEATLRHVTDELRSEAKLPGDWKPRVLIAQPGLGSSAYAERKNFAEMAFNSGKDFVVCIDTTDRFQWPVNSGDLRMLPIEENVSRRFERAVVAVNHLCGESPDAVLESQATRMLLSGRLGSVTVADLHTRGSLHSDFELNRVTLVGVPIPNQSVDKSFRSRRLGQMMAITTLSKTGLIASEPIRGVSSIQVHTRLGEPPSHGELFSEHWKGDHPNPIPELIGHYNRGMSIPAIQGWANESGNRVPMYTSGVTEPITTHLEMASMTRRGLTDPLHDAVLIGCKDSELGQKVAGQYGGNWRVQLVTETNSAKLQELAREQGFTRINRITDVSGPDVLPALPLGGQPFSSPWTLPEARSLAKGIERFNDTVGLLYKVADKDMPRGIQLPLEFAGPLIRDIQSGREGRFHPFASHVLEQAGRFGMSELPGLTKSLTKQGMLPASFKLHPAMAGVPDIVAGAASQIGRRELVPSIGEVTNYLDGVNKAAWATVGGLVSGPEGAAIASTSAGLAADVLREVTQPAFDRGAHTPVRRQMMESWRTHVKAAVAHGAPVQTFSKMFGEDFIRKTGFNQQVVADLDRRARLAEAIRPIGQGSSSGQLRPSDLSFDRAPVIVTPTQDEVWKRTPGFLPPDGFGGAGIPTTDYRLPSNVSLGGKRGGVAMRADVVTDKPADMSGIFGGGTSMRSTNQQSHLICPFLLFCAISSGSETE